MRGYGIWMAVWGLLGSLAAISAARAEKISVAVAANFTAPAQEIAALFRQQTGHEAVLSFGSSGTFYTQIVQGAPFQLLLSADEDRPARLIADGLASATTRSTYAIGTLVLWSRSPDLVQGEATLRGGMFRKLSIANPTAAPYGAAAIEVMSALHVHAALASRIVQGNSLAQAFHFIDTGNAELGFVALSQLTGITAGSRWVVPQTLYAPIRQDAVLLQKGQGSPASAAFLGFLKGPEAKAIIERYGYKLPAPN